ncbi:hypothetical protein QTQ03_17325 [Micromonospora sp. WMMA1363]|uniref:hypothetical protein n=1 Tax=Micromonospora sp. WMMA1363 TaxID=3053985 RepID=UPI00259CF7BE|nr:hypothetical protein [Micromonospora sp. WMMA1363]MDM4721279.1 hypothetical protein [Micromonospora sp. WMMA1363]
MSRSRTRATGPGRQRVAADPAAAGVDPDPVAVAWTGYLAAARQLDGVRRDAAVAAGEQARAVQTARAELAMVRARLARQEARLREAGVPPISLVPTPPELSEATRSMANSPTAVLAALRSAGDRAEAADAALAARGLVGAAGWPAAARNLLVYAPLALVVPLIQLVVFVATGPGPVTGAALICGLPMPAVAFVAGWLAVGRLFPPAAGGRVDRTTRLGGLVSLVPAVLVSGALLLVLLSG